MHCSDQSSGSHHNLLSAVFAPNVGRKGPGVWYPAAYASRFTICPETRMSDPVDTKKVVGRRTLNFQSFDDVLADAEQLASGEYRTVGNWSFGKILDHLAKSIHMMIDGADFRAPLPVRWFVRLMKNKMLTKPLPSGFKIPSKAGQVMPDDISTDEALQAFREAIQRAKSESTRAFHPFLGTLTQDEWDRFQLRHCEMHLSFVVPSG